MPIKRDGLTNCLKYLSLRAPEGCVAIRHAVSLRGAAPSAVLGAGCAIPPRFLGEFTLNEMNVLGMTFQVRLRSLS